ncbi:MAG: serine/threonine-protein kinase [Prosthecobacter sp.]|uniref:serine/threonine-protein kinase n=1 Tax=Prosthecobacter sp. TaxID=1965333 RepID=UPI003903A429
MAQEHHTGTDENRVTVVISHPTPHSASTSAAGTGPPLSGLDNYELLEPLGTGGMGTVVKARHKLLGRLVAIKTLRAELSHDPLFARRFQKEAQALAAIHHPNVVAIHDFGEAADGTLFLVMEHVEGPTLRRKLKRGPLAMDEALPLIRQICKGLEQAHKAGIVHRDLKPENILIGADGLPRVADFGLAVTHAAPNAFASFAGGPAGTLTYMAPEQKVPGGAVTPATDVFALGLIIYEILSGHVPEGAFEPLSSLVGAPPEIDDIVRRCLQADPLRRFANASLLYQALSRQERSLPDLLSRIDRRTLLIAAAGVPVLMLGGFGLGWMLLSRKIDLLEEKIIKIASGARYTAQADGSARIEVENKGEIRFQIDMSGPPSPVEGLRVRCDSSEPIKGFTFSVTDGKTTWNYVHPKPVPKGVWNTTIKAEKFTPVLDFKNAGALKEAVLTLETASGPTAPATMLMQELAFE